MREKNNPNSAERLYKFFIYLVLIMLAVSIIIPVAWVFMASIKQNKEFYGNPWTLPKGFYFQNFIDAWNTAKMGDYMLNSVFVTALALVILLIVALPAAYCLSRFKFKGSKFLNAAFMGGLFINVNYIVVPIFLMLRDGDNWLKSVILFNFLSFWNEYIISMTLMSSAKGPKTLPVGLLNLMQAQQSAAQYGIMYAGLVIVMLPTLILYICVQNKLTQGMTVGGLKG